MTSAGRRTARTPRFLWLRRAWLSEQLHAVLWLGLAMALIAVYVFIHVHYRPCYLNSISADLDNAVKQYTVQPNRLGRQLELTVGNTPYDPDTVDPGPLGIGELAPVKGLLVDTKVALDNYNANLARALTDLLIKFQPNVAHPGDLVAGLADVAPETYNDILETEPPRELRYQLRIPAQTIQSLLKSPRDEVAANTLVAAIKGSVAEKVTLSLPVTDAGADGLDDDIESVLTVPPVKKVALDAGNEVCNRLRGLGASLHRFFVDADSPAPVASNGQTKHCEFEGVYKGPTGVPATGARGESGDDNTDSTAPCTPGMGCYHQRLKGIAKAGVGFFWTAGNHLWIELVALTILGVVIRRLIDFGIVYARLRVVDGQTEAWEPRESLRTLIYMVTAPVLAVAIVWILTATDLIPADAIMFRDWTAHALIPLAFLLGLFPDLGHRVLTRLAEAIFSDIRGTRQLRRRSRRIAGPPTPPPPQGSGDEAPEAAPSLDALRLRIRFIYTSIVR